MQTLHASLTRTIDRWRAVFAVMALTVIAFAQESAAQGHDGSLASENAALANMVFRPNPVVDARGYIDVWALRRDVIAAEALRPAMSEDSCTAEGDPDDPPMSRQQQERLQRQERECEAKARHERQRFEAAHTAFNRSWLPKIKTAIAKGDAVAELIFLLCTTTDILDRGDEASTCHQAKEKRMTAWKRLQEIGFAPAYERCSPKQWNRAFTVCMWDYSNTSLDEFASLRLNRRPLTPGILIRGRLGAPSGNRGFVLVPPERERNIKDQEIDAILKQEPRWAVFLLTRIGRHEWVPEGSQSTTGQLTPEWLGRYELVRGAENWTDPLRSMTGVADIHQDGDGVFSITITSGARLPMADVTNCRLRYSGGLTFLPELTSSGQQEPTQTALGYYYQGYGRSAHFWKAGEADAALAPLNPKKRYRQVLMQCAEGESDENSWIRFLLLAGDTLLEFASGEQYDPKQASFIGNNELLGVRHFRRISKSAGGGEVLPKTSIESPHTD